MPELQHTVRRMMGRDPAESGRASTPLELLFDLTFVIAFGAASDELAHALVEDHVREGVLAFLLATFAVSWAWINFTWFASAYDTDDWPFRLTTMVQMVGVLVLALGLPDMFESIIEGEDQHADHLDHGEQPEEPVVGVVGGGEPREVDPGPRDRERREHEADDADPDVVLREVVGQPRD